MNILYNKNFAHLVGQLQIVLSQPVHETATYGMMIPDAA